jgi:hypothetical protein
MLPPKPEVDTWTTEPVVSRLRGVWGKRLDRFRDGWSNWHPPTKVNTGTSIISNSNGNPERAAAELHNLALKQGYESELVRYRRPTSWTVSVRQRGTKRSRFISDPIAGFDVEVPKSAGRPL